MHTKAVCASLPHSHKIAVVPIRKIMRSACTHHVMYRLDQYFFIDWSFKLSIIDIEKWGCHGFLLQILRVEALIDLVLDQLVAQPSVT